MGLFGLGDKKEEAAVVVSSKPRILLCEDDAFFSQALTLILTSAGYELIVAQDGQVGVNTLAQNQNFKMILCDIKMPNIDGFGVLKYAKSVPTTSTIPFIFLTGVADMASMDRATELGARDYFIKANTGLPKIIDLVKKYI